ncbi:MAG: hypothetical protein J0I12_30910 [Candidatus Eremiobacteraeota bacterium]|nr:hypothetical protein [Candidatus Eremiobacteraeota bacterium]
MNISALSSQRSLPTTRSAAPRAETPAANDQVQIGNNEPAAPKKWTVLLWSASDNNLYSYMQKDIDECEQVGSTPGMNVVVQTDHGPRFGTAKRYLLTQDDKPGIHSPVVSKPSSNNTADPAQLSEFIQWGMQKYPAENYALIISDHGGGWQGACSDDRSNSWMTLPMLEQGLSDAREKTGRKLDVLGFDACLMASAEVAHQLRDEATYLVGSQETEGGAGWQYNRVLSKDTLASTDERIRTRLDYTPKEFAENIVNMAQGHQGDLATMTAFDTSKIGAITDSVKSFGEAIVNSPISSADLAAAKGETQGFYEFHDLHDFASKVAAKAGDDANLAAKAAAVQQAIGDAIIAEQHSESYPNAHGVTIELSNQSGRAKGPGVPNFSAEQNNRIDFGKYGDTKFAQETGWQAAQAKING